MNRAKWILMGTLIGGVATTFAAAHAQSRTMRTQARANASNTVAQVVRVTPAMVEVFCLDKPRAIEEVANAKAIAADERIFDRI